MTHDKGEDVEMTSTRMDYWNREDRVSEISDMRKAFGLNLYEAKIFWYLLRLDKCGVGDLSYYCMVPYSRVFDVLDSLATKGLVRCLGGHPGRWVTCSRRKIMEREKEKESARLKMCRRLLHSDLGP